MEADTLVIFYNSVIVILALTVIVIKYSNKSEDDNSTLIEFLGKHSSTIERVLITIIQNQKLSSDDFESEEEFKNYIVLLTVNEIKNTAVELEIDISLFDALEPYIMEFIYSKI